MGSPATGLNGYYTWARLGYNASLTDHERARTSEADLNGLMGHREGPDWWRRHGGERWMSFDLAPASRQSHVHRAYLTSKGVRIRRR